MQISSAIQKYKDIQDALNGVVGDEVVPHRAFVVHPSNDNRYLDGCLVKAISKGAMDIIIKILDERVQVPHSSCMRVLAGFLSLLLSGAICGNTKCTCTTPTMMHQTTNWTSQRA